MEVILTDECVPAVHYKTGKILNGSSGKSQARRILESRDGPCPHDKHLCRHTCKNDSTAPNGFVCVKHILWGTYSENEMDKSPETRAHSASAAGKASAASASAFERNSKAGKAAKLSPLNAINMQVTCPHCGKVGAKLAMSRYHFDRCKFNSGG